MNLREFATRLNRAGFRGYATIQRFGVVTFYITPEYLDRARAFLAPYRPLGIIFDLRPLPAAESLFTRSFVWLEFPPGPPPYHPNMRCTLPKN
jgi:hypothetical protein